MLDQRSNPLLALVDVATSLRPIPTAEDVEEGARSFSTAISRAYEAYAHENAAVAVVSEDERSQDSFSSAGPPSRGALKASSSPVPSSSAIAGAAVSMATMSSIASKSATPPYDDEQDLSSSSKSRTKARPLPLMLMELLTDPAHAEVISFLPKGEAFAILRPNVLENGEALRKLFRCVRVTTFVRKLENWGFVRHSSAGGRRPVLAFSHPLFKKGDWESCSRIRCQKKRGTPGSSLQSSLGQLLVPTLPALPALETNRPPAKAVTATSTGMSDESMAPSSSLVRSPSPADEAQPVAESAAQAEVAQASLRCMLLRQRHARQGEELRLRRLQLQQGRVSAPATAVTPQYFSQDEIDLATRSIVGAAMDVLARDPNSTSRHGRRPQSPPSSPLALVRRHQAALDFDSDAAFVASAERITLLRRKAELAAARSRRAAALLASQVAGRTA
mmetsp:Transcript_18423/g.53120  ORF Transcript_18423/g.53120 Transcript_18423/m.53120 type:complete len:447 (-) Transcript_18423:41-1381(-)